MVRLPIKPWLCCTSYMADKMKMNLLYITYIDFGQCKSGSSVRPQCIYQAFVECGCEVKLLEGLQNRRHERKQRVRETLEWLKNHNPDICYIEPPTGPLFNGIDHRLIRMVHRNGIPIGLFYRDAYWKYGLTKKGKGAGALMKDFAIRMLQARDLKRFKKYCDIIYLPTQTAAESWGFERYKLLPPGCDTTAAVPQKSGSTSCALYVGGVGEMYGTSTMLDAFSNINKGKVTVRLKLICRENEWAGLDEIYRDLEESDWLEVLHISGDALAQQYAAADFAIHPLKKTAYNDTAMPVKIMEYLAYGKPMVVTNCVEMSRFVTENHIGIVADNTAKDMERAILRLAQDTELRHELENNCYIVRERHAWRCRAEQVLEELSSVNPAHRHR